MNGNQGNRNRLFYLLCVVLALVSIFSLIQIIRDISTTAHIRQVNAQVQDLMPDAEETPPAEPAVYSAGTENAEAVADPNGADVMGENSATDAVDSAGTAENAEEATPTPVRVYQLSDGKMQEDIARLAAENPDCIGWLRIPEVVDLPVMYSPDGNYYETHDFYGNESAGGTLFLDTMHPLQSDIQHLVIHGHNMKDGTMFGHLLHYEQEAYWKSHPTVTWITPWRTEFYDIFCVAIVSTDYASDQYLNYLTPTAFATEAEMGNWLAKLRALSLHWKEPKATLDDALLTLSTCIGEDRLLVVSKRIQY